MSSLFVSLSSFILLLFLIHHMPTLCLICSLIYICPHIFSHMYMNTNSSPASALQLLLLLLLRRLLLLLLLLLLLHLLLLRPHLLLLLLLLLRQLLLLLYQALRVQEFLCMSQTHLFLLFIQPFAGFISFDEGVRLFLFLTSVYDFVGPLRFQVMKS